MIFDENLAWETPELLRGHRRRDGARQAQRRPVFYELSCCRVLNSRTKGPVSDKRQREPGQFELVQFNSTIADRAMQLGYSG